MTVSIQPAGSLADGPRGVVSRAAGATRRFWPVLVLDVTMVIAFSLWQPTFFTWSNVLNILTSVSIVWFVALGMTLVLISAGFDLSVGAIATVSGIVLAKLLSAGVPSVLAIVLAVVAGGVMGAVLNGLLVGKLGLSVFVVTLASMTALTGAASLWTDTQTLPVTDSVVLGLVTDRLAGLPVVVWVMAAAFLVTLYLQRMTHFGRDVYAVGGSMAAARLSGIRTPRVLMGIYLFVGLCAGLGGVVAAGRVGGAAPQVDNTLALQAIAAVLLGGTSLVGGIGGVGGTAFGVLFVGILQNGLSIAGVETFWQQVITGVILVVAVAGDKLQGLGRLRPRRGSAPPSAVPAATEAPDETLPAPLGATSSPTSNSSSSSARELK